MVLQMLSDTRKLDYDIDTGVRQHILRADTAVHQHMWTTYRTTGNNDFAVHCHCLSCRTAGSSVLDAGSFDG